MLTTVLNDLDALTGEVVLVLDDYHLIASESIHEASGFPPRDICRRGCTWSSPRGPTLRSRCLVCGSG